MKRLYLILLTAFLLYFPSVKANLIINEIMYNPDQCSDSYCEWLELYNPMNESVNLTGWTICNIQLLSGYINHTDGRLYSNISMILNSSSFAIVTDGGTGTDVYDNFNVSQSSIALHVDASSICGGLSNSGGTISLNHSNGTIIDSVSYNSSWGANGNNKTLERIDPSGSSNSTNWNESSMNGTPGYRNSVTPSDHNLAVYADDVYINPVDPSPRTGLNITALIRNLGLINETNANISFYNISNYNSNLINSTLLNISKQSSQNLTVIWNNISSGNYTILISISNVANEGNTTDNNATKNVTVKFRLVMNEIMYNPPDEIGSDVDFEYVEIYNNASYDENLTHWSLKCDTETSSPKTKNLDGTLESGKFLVLAKDVSEFYTYYSPSIKTTSQTCSLNNDGELVKLVFNNSNTYHEEIVVYSPSWGADGTGYSLEKINPASDNSTSNWAESIMYGGTPGFKNNPDNKTKPPMKQTETVYKYSSGSSSIIAKTSTDENYEIKSYQDSVHIGEEFETTVSLKSDTRKNVTVYSYVFDGNKLFSEGFDEETWKKTWDANKKTLLLSPSHSIDIILKNRIKENAPLGVYRFRVRIDGEKDLTKEIVVLPKIIAQNKMNNVSLSCKNLDDSIQILIQSDSQTNVQLFVFSENKMDVKNFTINKEQKLSFPNKNYYYFLLVGDNSIIDKCSINLMPTSSKITGRIVNTENLSYDFVQRIISWFKSVFQIILS